MLNLWEGLGQLCFHCIKCRGGGGGGVGQLCFHWIKFIGGIGTHIHVYATFALSVWEGLGLQYFHYFNCMRKLGLLCLQYMRVWMGGLVFSIH